MVVKHSEDCTCGSCLAHEYGKMIDELGARTSPGGWQKFGTTTFRTPNFPWSRGFPSNCSFRPNAEFARNIFNKFILHLESVLGQRVDFFVADQLGTANGRLHQHFVMAAPGLDDCHPRAISAWLDENAGYNRILPFRHGAAFYISRFFARDAQCDWNFRVGESSRIEPVKKPVGRVDVARSVDLPSDFFHSNRRRF